MTAACSSEKLKEAAGGESNVINVVKGELAKAFWEWEFLHKSWPETQTAEFLSGAEQYDQNMDEQEMAEWYVETQRQWELELAHMIEEPGQQA